LQLVSLASWLVYYPSVLVTLILFFLGFPAQAEVNHNVSISDEIEIPLYQYKPAGKSKTGSHFILWLPSEAGILEQEKNIAKRLSRQGIEVWFADLHSGLFISKTTSSIDKFTPKIVSKIIQHLIKKTGKNLVLVSNSRGIIALLKGAHHWQVGTQKSNDLASKKKSSLLGAILISPQFYRKTPEPGFEGKLRKIVKNTNMAIMIIQPNRSPFYWKLKKCIDALSKQGSAVLTWIIDDVRDRFYYRPDSTKREDTVAKKLDWYLYHSIRLLKPFAGRHTKVLISKKGVSKHKPSASKKPKLNSLRLYKAVAKTPILKLKNISGQNRDLQTYKGKVILVNFWASWCPPCVHEMPSMQLLENKYKSKGFQIIAVNMAEDSETIKQFLKSKVKVDFKIWLDSSGVALKAWKVFAFPTSYLLDKKGRIRYAVYGAIDWTSADVFKKVELLLKEK